MAAIGIFDSGVGGLTVLKALKEILPHESFIYLGDTARLPYGSKSPEIIKDYLSQNIVFLESRGVKALVVACNTASTVLRDKWWGDLPIYGVIEPGARVAQKATKNGKIGVLGTRATVESGAYLKALKNLDSHLTVIQQPCPLLVPLVEEGWEEDPVTKTVLSRYLEKPLAEGVDTLILGCTHYPVLKKTVAELTGENIALVDSARAIALQMEEDLLSGRIPAERGSVETEVWTTDTNHVFQEVGLRILDPIKVAVWGQAHISISKREYAKL